MAVHSQASPNTLFAFIENRGIRQDWLAKQLGISPQYLTHIKVGRRPVPDWLPEKAAAALGVPVFLLFPDYEAAHV